MIAKQFGFNVILIVLLILLFVFYFFITFILIGIFEYNQGIFFMLMESLPLQIINIFFSLTIFSMNIYVVRNNKILNYFLFSGLPLIVGGIILLDALSKYYNMKDRWNLIVVGCTIPVFWLLQLIVWYIVNRIKCIYFPNEN